MSATLTELRNSLGGPSAEYRDKMLHRVPDAPTIDREKFILGRCAGKTVLDIGASGPLHDGIVTVTKRCYGIDKPSPGWSSVQGPEQDGDKFGIDLDDFHANLPGLPSVELVVCGEVLEHLSNPGWLLDRVRATYSCPVIITVPNAFSDAGRPTLERGVECVNREHVAWYSFHTLKELVTRYRYSIREHYWYKGRPRFSEGLIFVVE